MKRLPAILVLLTLAVFAAFQLAARPYVDHDVYHEMALWRAALQRGAIPTEELFSFTPTVALSVHHEWGTGAILYGLTQGLAKAGMSGAGLAGLRLVLYAAILGACAWCSRRRGASWVVLCATAPIFIMPTGLALSPVRAQLFSMLLLAATLAMLDMDRAGKRSWIAAWFPMYIVWLNLHAGFVIGPVVLFLHWVEQVVRTRRPQWHLIGVGLSAVPLAAFNPYGINYVRYLVRAITMPRPLIAEWGPLWQDPATLALFLFAALLAGYVLLRSGRGGLPGIAILAFLALESLLHLRHVTLFAVAWACYVPGPLSKTPLATVFEDIWRKRRLAVGLGYAAIGVCLAGAMWRIPMRVRLPVRGTEDKYPIVMPVGPVAYLKEIGFGGKLMTPFDGGSYVMWHLGPAVKVGMDSRYEVAYLPGVVERVAALYNAEPGWEETLAAYRPDLVLTPRRMALDAAMADSREWKLVYRDDACDLFAGAASDWTLVDRTGRPIPDSFP